MSGANQARTPITEDDAFLAHVVADVGLVQLLCSVVHMTGSLDAIRGVPTSVPRFNGDGGGQIPAEQAVTLRARALEAIKAWRDAGCPDPYRPTDDEFHAMLCFLVGVEMPRRYVPAVKIDMAYEDEMRSYVWGTAVAQDVKARNPVLIIGAGMSGLAMALRLKHAGIPVKVVEKNRSVGGTWFENSYPGCRVDVASHSYSFPFMQDYRWPTLYSSQPELEKYFNELVDRFGLRELIELDTEVVRAAYDEGAHTWNVTLRGRDGAQRVEHARSLVSAVGQLNRARIPEIDGLGTFAGDSFHTSAWRHDVDLRGKRVAVVGAAATGLQVIPEVAKLARHLTVFMRSPNWLSVHPEYRREIRETEHWAFEHLPYYAGWTRNLYFNWPFDRTPHHFKIDPEWQGDPRSISKANDLSRIRMTDGIERFLADTPELIDKLVPRYPPFLKRPNVIDGGFLRAMQQDHVDLVTERIERIVPEGIVDATGTLHEADVLVFATGFHAQKFLHPMEIRGRGGVTLNEYWNGLPGGHYGIVVPSFPNFYMMYGPGTNLGFNGNLIFNSECQASYIISCIGRMISAGLDEVEVRRSVYDAYMQRTGEELSTFVWNLDVATNWFRNDQGRVTTNSPWSLVDYWTWTKEQDPSDFLEPGERQST